MQKLILTLCLALAGSLLIPAEAQQYKLKQRTAIMGMNSETTIYVKGKRKRTEPGSMMGMIAPPTTIEQCDLQRTIHINNKKKLYFIEPFSKEEEDVIDEDAPKPKTTPAKPVAKTTKEGGIITLYYSITDTGERKQMYGLTARHIWTYQKIKPSPDACSMKDSIIIKTDGWYIDLPQWTCPVRYSPNKEMMRNPMEKQKPTCQDKFVVRRKGKGKLGFALTETMTIIMAGMRQEMTTANETVEFSAAKLDSMLFEIPLGYTETKNKEDLEEYMETKIGDINMDEVMKNMGIDKDMGAVKSANKQPGMIRIGVFAPTGDEQVTPVTLQARMVSALHSGKVEAVAVDSDEEAQQFNCDYTLNAAFTRIKSGSKVGGLLKAVKNADPNAASQFNIQANLTLKALSGDIKTQPSVDGKFEGKVDEAAAKAMEDGCRQVLKALK